MFYKEKEAESEANSFASELLLPEKLIKGDLANKSYISFDFIRNLSETKYKSSLTSTAIRLVSLIDIPTILICSNKGRKKWFLSSKKFNPYIPLLKTDELKFLGSNKDALNSVGGKVVSFSKWFYSDNKESSFNIREEHFATNYGVLSLLSPVGDFKEQINV
jgi:hypothetical protein